LSLYYLRLSFGHCIVSVPLKAFLWSIYCFYITYVFRLVIVLSLFYLRFRLVIVLSLYYLRISFGHCIISVLLIAFVWSLYCLCPTYGFRLVIVLSLFYVRFPLVMVLSLYYLRLTLGYCIVSVLLKALVWSLYCLCTTYGFRLVIVLSLYYLWLSLGHCIVSVLLTAFRWSLYCPCITYGFRLSLYCLCYTYGFRLVIVLSL
jgi:hypothetical protein